MRPKVVIAVLVLAVGLLGALALLSKVANRLTSPGTSTEAAANPSSNSRSTQIQKPPALASESVAPSPVVLQPQTNHAEYVHQRVAELNALAMNNDSATLETILSELRNPDRQIRKGALEATIQFEDRAAIPRLREIAAETDDEDEKADLLAAADYLNLPSLTEYLAEQQTQQDASGITNSPHVRQPNPHFQRPPRLQMQSQAAAQGGQ